MSTETGYFHTGALLALARHGRPQPRVWGANAALTALSVVATAFALLRIERRTLAGRRKEQTPTDFELQETVKVLSKESWLWVATAALAASAVMLVVTAGYTVL